MDEENKLPWVIGVIVVVLILTLLLLPPELLNIFPDKEDPIADAGPDITITFGERAILDGSASSDDKGITSFVWMVENGNETVFIHSESISFSFRGPGEYRAVLTVTDGAGKEATDEVVVVVLE